jgi:hypothetical protein
MVKEEKPKQIVLPNSDSVYNSIVEDLDSLDNSRSIVKFMRYVQRQNKLVERVRKNQEQNISLTEEELFNTIDDELKEELKDLKLKNRTNVKNLAYIDDDDENDENDNEDIIEKQEDNEDLKSNKSNSSTGSNIIQLNVNLDEDEDEDEDEDKDEDEDDKLIEPNQPTIANMSDNNFDNLDNLDNFEELKPEKYNNANKINIINDINENNKPEEICEKANEKVGEEVEVKNPEDYIKVYWKVCRLGDTKKINEFDNGQCEFTFIWKYENFHKQFDWYNSDAEVIYREIEERL